MPTVPGYADVSLELVNAALTRPAYVTFGVDPTATDPAIIAADVYNAVTYAGSFMSIIDTQVTLVSVRVSYGTDGSADLVFVQPSTAVGGNSGTSLPPNNAALIHKVTARGGRRGRGRMYIPWCLALADAGEGGAITSARQTALNNAMAVLKTRLETASTPMVLLHNPGHTSMGAPDLVTALRADNLIGTQRRRVGR
jgi:hypothetical protein